MLQRSCEHLRGPSLFAHDVSIVGFRGTEKLDDTITLQQRNNADDLVRCKDD